MSAEFAYEDSPWSDKQLKLVIEKKIPFIIWVGEEESKTNIFKIKNIYKNEENFVALTDLIETAKMLSSNYKQDLNENKVVFTNK